MNVPLDPYRDWLQIPLDRRPPTHYDLLGLPAFESAESKIRAAATQRISHVRKYQVGVHSDLAIRLMGEISRALTCLTDPTARQEYDAQLRSLKTVADAASSGQATLLQEAVAVPSVVATSAFIDKPNAPPDVPSSQPESESSARFLIIVGVGFAAAVALVFLGGWMLSHSNQKQGVESAGAQTSAASEEVPRPAPLVEQNSTAPPEPVAVPQDKSCELIDVVIAAGRAHLLLQRAEGLVEAVTDDLNVAAGLNDMQTSLEANSPGEMLDVEGEREPGLPSVFADRTPAPAIRLSSLQRRDAVGLQIAPLKITDELSFLHRLRPPVGTLVEFEAVYQGLDSQSKLNDCQVQLKSKGPDQRVVLARFAIKQAQIQIGSRFRAGQTVLVQATIGQGPHPGRLDLTGWRMEVPGNNLESFLGVSVSAVRVTAVMQQWNDVSSTVPSTPGSTSMDLPAALARLNWTAPQPVASTAPTPPPGVAPRTTTPPASAPGAASTNTQRSYYGFVVPNPVNGIIRTHPERTITDHGNPLTLSQYDLAFRQDGRLLQGGTYHLFKIPASGAIRFTWTGTSTSTQIGLRYWNGSDYTLENIPGGQGSATRSVSFRPASGDQFGYVMINAPSGTLATDYFMVQTGSAGTPVASAKPPATIPARPPAPINPPRPVANVPSPQLLKALAEVDNLIDKNVKSKFANEDTWGEVVANLGALESQVTAKAEQDEVKRLRKRLAKVAADRLDAAIRQRNKNLELYSKFLREAVAVDPDGDTGRRAQELLNAAF